MNDQKGHGMSLRQKPVSRHNHFLAPVIFLFFLIFLAPHPASGSPAPPADPPATTPIRHIIIVIGENWSFDSLFATYIPRQGQHVRNLLSEGIVRPDGSPGPHFSIARQFTAVDTDHYRINPRKAAPYPSLPLPNTNNAPENPFVIDTPEWSPDPGLEQKDMKKLRIGGTGLPPGSPDTRFPRNLLNGPFPITRFVSYSSYLGSPAHRFFQNWQEADCDHFACRMDLFTWVSQTTGIGGNGSSPPVPFTGQSTRQGGIQMGFYNMAAGDAPFLKWLADHFTLSDNDHQAVMGGTGANHIALATGDAFFDTDSRGNPATPPRQEIENPDPMKGSNNWYTQDGYSGGSFVRCADRSQPGVGAIRDYLDSASGPVPSRCEPGRYYLLNNGEFPGYHRNGTPTTSGFYLPPTDVPTIGEALSAHHVSWAYFGEGFYPGHPRSSLYCNFCNPFQYSRAIMTTSLKKDIGGLSDFYRDLNQNKLPAVSFVKPDSLLDGHPSFSRPELFEGFVRKVVDRLRKSADWKDTALFITFDESGGFYDSGPIQPVDFFGDGPRVPLIVVSPYTTGGRVVHTYYDHVSLLKFIEKNWDLPPLSSRSRDNLPDPVPGKSDPYLPGNGPAIGNMMEMFHFNKTGKGDLPE